MTIDLIPANASREARADEAAITQIMVASDTPTEWAAAIWAMCQM